MRGGPNIGAQVGWWYGWVPPEIHAMVVRLEDGESVVMVPAERPPDRTPMSDSQHRMLRHLADWAHLDRSQRLELASMVLNRQVGTWRYLSCFEASRLIDHLQGYLLINQVHNTPVPEPSKTLRRSSRSDR